MRQNLLQGSRERGQPGMRMACRRYPLQVHTGGAHTRASDPCGPCHLSQRCPGASPRPLAELLGGAGEVEHRRQDGVGHAALLLHGVLVFVKVEAQATTALVDLVKEGAWSRGGGGWWWWRLGAEAQGAGAATEALQDRACGCGP